MKFLLNPCAGIAILLFVFSAGCKKTDSPTADSGAARTEATVNHRDASEAVTGGAQTSAAGGSGSGGGGGGGSAVDTAEQSSAASDSASDESMGAADSTGESSTEPPSTQGPQYFKPQATVLESLNQTPEVMVNLNGYQGYIPYVTDKWLYFSGSINGPAVFRLKKEPGAELEKIIDGFLTNIGNFYFEDGMMYLLSEEVLYRWPEDEPERLEQFDLEQAHFRFKSDAEHFIAITYSSQDVTLFDKQTLEPHTIALEPLPAGRGGGAYDVASDGERIYCTRYNIPGILYVLEKATEQVTRFELEPFEQRPDTPIGLAGFFVENGKLYGNFYKSNYFGYVESSGGEAVALAAPNGWAGRTDPVLPEAGTNYVYFGARALDGNVYRYDYKRFVALPLMKEPTGLWTATGFAMDDTHVYFMSRRDPLNTGAPVGILRVRKPD